MFGFGMFCREKHCASAEVDVFYLDFYKFSNSAAELVNHLKHQLMTVIVNTVEKTLEFINCEIANDLAEAFMSLCFAFSFSTCNWR